MQLKKVSLKCILSRKVRNYCYLKIKRSIKTNILFYQKKKKTFIRNNDKILFFNQYISSFPNKIGFSCSSKFFLHFPIFYISFRRASFYSVSFIIFSFMIVLLLDFKIDKSFTRFFKVIICSSSSCLLAEFLCTSF